MRELPIQSNIPENIKDSVKEVSIKGLEATEKYIPESDPLKEYATRLFLNLESEYKRIQEKSLSDDDIKEEMEKVSAIFENKARFVEEVQKLKEKEEARVRLKERLKQNSLATDEEFSAGVYKDELESQVSEAVFAFKRKGYETFESGFDIGRDQMIGVYNKNIVLP